MGNRLRLGILGTGNIARQFAAGLGDATRTTIAAVASRRAESADAFAATHKIPRAYSSYEQLMGDNDVDAVYISLPNSLHHEWTIAALRAGKHVLCEKPLAVTAAEGADIFPAAERSGRVLMEAFMYRCHPQTHAVQREVAAGRIGQVRQI